MLLLLFFVTPTLAQQIVTDGRTQTNLATTGNVTDVTTSTISGSNAFNSFSKFNVDGGNVVNLQLPGSTSNLINIVTGQRSDINGTLNSIKNNQIGGNVYFVNPHGVVVGASGVINVGALSLSTTTQSFADGFFSGGTPSSSSTSALLNGSASILDSAVIQVDGTINSLSDIRLAGGTVSISGTVQNGASFQATAPGFSDVVNTNGYNAGSRIVAADGDIEIVGEASSGTAVTVSNGAVVFADGGSIGIDSDSDVAISGTLKANKTDPKIADLLKSNGSVAIKAKGNVTINGNLVAASEDVTLSDFLGKYGDYGLGDFLELFYGEVNYTVNFPEPAPDITIDLNEALNETGFTPRDLFAAYDPSISLNDIREEITRKTIASFLEDTLQLEKLSDILTDATFNIADISISLDNILPNVRMRELLPSDGNLEITSEKAITLGAGAIASTVDSDDSGHINFYADGGALALGNNVQLLTDGAQADDGGKVDLYGDTGVSFGTGMTISTGRIRIESGAALTIPSSLSAKDGDIELVANGALTIAANVQLSSLDSDSQNQAGDITLEGATVTLASGVGLLAYANPYAGGKVSIDSNGAVSLPTNLTLNAGTISIAAGVALDVPIDLIAQGGDITLKAGDDLTVSHDLVGVSGTITLKSGSAITDDVSIASSLDIRGANIEIDAGGNVTVQSNLSAATTGAGLDDLFTAAGNISIDAGGDLSLQANLVATAADVTIGTALGAAGSTSLADVLDDQGQGAIAKVLRLAGVDITLIDILGPYADYSLSEFLRTLPDFYLSDLLDATGHGTTADILQLADADVNLTALLPLDGNITAIAAGNIAVQAGKIISVIDTDYAGDIKIEAEGLLTLGSAVEILAETSLVTDDGGLIRLYGGTGVSLATDLVLAGGGLDIESGVSLSIPAELGPLTAIDGNIRLTAADDLTLGSGMTLSTLDSDAHGKSGDITLTAGGNLPANTNSFVAEDPSLPNDGGTVTLHAGGTLTIPTSATQLRYGGIDFESGAALTIPYSLYALDADIRISSDGLLTVNNGLTFSALDSDGNGSAGDLTMYGGGGVSVPSDWLDYAHDITIESGVGLSLPVDLTALGGNISLQAGDHLIVTTLLTASDGRIELAADHNILITSGVVIRAESIQGRSGDSILSSNVDFLASDGDVTFDAGDGITFVDGGSLLAPEGDIDVVADNDVSVGSGMEIRADNVSLDAGGDITVLSDMTAEEKWPSLNAILAAATDLNVDGLLAAIDDISFELLFSSSGNVSLDAKGNVEIGNVTLYADGGNLNLEAGKSITANNATLVGAAGDVSLVDLLLPDGNVTMTAQGGSITLTGEVRASVGPLSLNALKNALGDIKLVDLLQLAGDASVDAYNLIGFDIVGFISDLGSVYGFALDSLLDYLGHTANNVNAVLESDLLQSITLDDFLALGGKIRLEADGHLVIGSNTLITTRQISGTDYLNAVSANDSGDIHILAKNVEINSGTQVLAHVSSGSGYAAGDITIDVTDARFGFEDLLAELFTFDPSDPDDYFELLEKYWNIISDRFSIWIDRVDPVDDTEVDAVITGATIKGRDISITSYINNPSVLTTRNAGGKILVTDTTISGRDVTLRAEADTSLFPDAVDELIETVINQSEFAQFFGVDFTGVVTDVAVTAIDDTLNMDMYYQESQAITKVSLGGASSITASGDVVLAAESEVRAKPVGDFIILQAAYADATAHATATVDGESVVTADGNVTITSEVTGEVSATAVESSLNLPVLMFTWTDLDAESTAGVASGAQVSGDKVTIGATNENTLITSSTAVSVGSGMVVVSVALETLDIDTTAHADGVIVARDGLDISATSDLHQTSVAKASNLGDPNSTFAKLTYFQQSLDLISGGDILGAAVGKFTGFKPNASKFAASASVAVTLATNDVDAYIGDGASVLSGGAINIDAEIYDVIGTTVASSAASTGSTVGGGLALGTYADNAKAYIGDGAEVDASGAISIESDVTVPLPLVEALDIDNFYSTLSTNPEGFLFTTHVRNSASGSASSGIGLAVAADYLSMTQTSESYIGAAAQVNQDLAYWTADQSVKLRANTNVATVNGDLETFSTANNSVGGQAVVHLAETSAKAYIDDGAVVHANGDITLEADSDLVSIDFVIAGGAGNNAALKGALSYLDHYNEAITFVGSGATLDTAGDVKLESTGGTVIFNLSGAVAKSAAKGVGVSASVLMLDSIVKAYLESGSGTITANTLDLTSHTTNFDQGYSVAGAVASGDATNDEAEGSVPGANTEVSLAGDAVYQELTTDTHAYIGDGWNVTTVGSVDVTAEDDLDIWAAAGSVSINTGSNEGYGIGGSYVHNIVDQETKAYVDGNVTLGDGASLTIDADAVREMVAISASLSGGSTSSNLSGTVAANQLTSDTAAYVVGDVTADDLKVIADEDSTITTGAGSATITGGKKGFGVAIAYTDVDVTTEAYVDGDLSLSGDLTLLAHDEIDLDAGSMAAVVGFRGADTQNDLVVGGGITFSNVELTTESWLAGSGEIDGSAAIAASSDSDILSISGDVNVSLSGNAFGAASSTVLRSDTVKAGVASGSDFTVSGAGSGIGITDARGDSHTVDGLGVYATSREKVEQYAVGASVAIAKSGGVGSLTISETTDTTDAYIGADTIIDSDEDVAVVAEDTTDIIGVAGAGAYGSKGGYGGGLDLGLITKTTRARIYDGASVRALGDVLVASGSDEDISSIAGSVGVSTNGNALSGSADAYKLTLTTEAYIDDASVIADDNVIVAATESTQLDIIAGTLAVSTGGTGAGGSVGVVLIDKTTKAWIGADAEVVARALGSNVASPTGAFSADFEANTDDDGEVIVPSFSIDSDNGIISAQRVVSPETVTMQGVSVTATNQDDIEAISVAGAIATSGNAVGVSGLLFILEPTTHAYVDTNAQINQSSAYGTADADQSVHVAAGNDLYHLGVAGAVAGGNSAAVAPGVDVTMVTADTRAWIAAGADVDAKRNIAVYAQSEESMLSIAGGIAGAAGAIAVAGGVQFYSLDNTTYAYSAADTLDAGGTIAIHATDDTDQDTIAGSVALAAGGAAFAGSVIVTQIEKDTQARVDAGRITGLGNGSLAGQTGVDIVASSTEDVLAIGASGGGSTGLTVAGAVNVSSVASNTKASIANNTKVNNDNSGAESTQDVRVIATNHTIINDFVGVIAGSLSGSIAGSADVTAIRNNTTASVGTGVTINALDQIVVEATGEKDLYSIVASGSGGVLSIAGALGIYTITDALDSTQASNFGLLSNYIDEQTGNSASSDLLAESDQSEADAIANAAATRVGSANPSTNLTSAASTGTSATIGSSARLNAGGNVRVVADEDVVLNAIVGGVSAGLLGGGAGIGMATFGTDAQAYINASSVVAAGGDLTVSATRDVDARVDGFAGAVQLGIGTQAVYASVEDNGSTTADLYGLVSSAEDISVTAVDHRVLDANAYGGSSGIVGAMGASSAYATASGTTRAAIGSSSQITPYAGAYSESINVNADSSTLLDANAYAGGAGVGEALSGTSSAATSARTTSASIGTFSTIASNGNVNVEAVSIADSDAEVFSVNLAGGVSAGKSAATATTSNSVTAAVGNSSSVTGEHVGIYARHNTDSSGNALSGRGATATAFAVGGAVGFAGSGADATASHVVNVSAAIGNNATVSGSGDQAAYDAGWNNSGVGVTSLGDASADAKAEGYGGAIIALADVNTTSTSTLTNSASLGSSSKVKSAFGDISFAAVSQGTSKATSKGGQGGLSAVSGTNATANLTRVTTTSVGSGATIDATGNVNLKAFEDEDIAKSKGTITTVAGVSTNTTRATTVASIGTTVEVGQNAKVSGATLSLFAEIFNLDVEADAHSETIAADSTSKANSTVWANVATNVNIRSGVQLTSAGGLGLNIISLIRDAVPGANDSTTSGAQSSSTRDGASVITAAEAKAEITGATGTTIATARSNVAFAAEVLTEAGSSLTGSAVNITAESPHDERSAYILTADATADTLVNYVLTWVNEYVDKIEPVPLLGDVVRTVTKKVLKWVAEWLNSEESSIIDDASTFSTRNTITHNGAIRAGFAGNPRLVVGEDGTILESFGLNGTSVTADAIDTGTVMTLSPAGIHLVAQNGEVYGSGSIEYTNRNHSATFINHSDRTLNIGSVGLIDAQPFMLANNADVYITSNADDDAQPTFTSTVIEVIPQLVVENYGAGDVVFTGTSLSSQVGRVDVNVANYEGSIYSAAGATFFDVGDLTLYAPEGAIGASIGTRYSSLSDAQSDPQRLTVKFVSTADFTPTITADARHSINLDLQGVIAYSDAGALQPMIALAHVESDRGDVALTGRDGVTKGKDSNGIYADVDSDAPVSHLLHEISAGGNVLIGKTFADDSSYFVGSIVAGATSLDGAVNVSISRDGTFADGEEYLAAQTATAITLEGLVTEASKVELDGTIAALTSTTPSILVNPQGAHPVTIANLSALDLILPEISGWSVKGSVFINAALVSGSYNGIAIGTLSAASGSPTVTITNSGPSDIFLTGEIDGSGSTLTINNNDGSILALSNSYLIGSTLAFTASNGAIQRIGGDGSVRAILSSGGVDASAEYDIALSLYRFGNTINIGQIKSTSGDVWIYGDWDLGPRTADAQAKIIGDAITITNEHDISLGIDSKSAVTVVAPRNIILTEVSGDLNVKQITSSTGHVTITAAGSILDYDDTDVHDIYGRDVRLYALNGSIGTLTNLLEVDSSTSLTLTATKDIGVAEVSGDMALFSANSTAGSVTLTAIGSITDVLNDTEADVVGKAVCLSSSAGTLGDSSNDLDIDAKSTVTLAGYNGIYVEELTLDIALVSAISANGAVQLVTPRSILGSKGGADDVQGTSVSLTAGSGSIKLDLYSSSGWVRLLAASGYIDVESLNGGMNLDLVQASGDVTLKAQYLLDATLNDSTTADIIGRDITLTATAGNLGYGNADLELDQRAWSNRFVTLSSADNIAVNAPYRDLILQSVEAVGDISLSAARAITPGEVDYAKPIISGNAISLSADAVGAFYDGGLYRTRDLVIDGTALSATGGSGGIHIYKDGDLILDAITETAGGATVAITATGALNGSGAAIRPGSLVRLTALGGGISAHFVELDATNILVLNARDAIDVTATGTIGVGYFTSTSRGNIQLVGDGMRSGEITGGDVDVTMTTGDLGTFTIEIDADSLTAYAAGDMSFEATGDLNLAGAVAGGIMNLYAAGSIVDVVGSDTADLTAQRIWLTAGTADSNGTIGSASNRLLLDAELGEILKAASDIYVIETIGDMPLYSASSTHGNVYLVGRFGIVDASNDAAADVVGKRVEISANASIGSASRYLGVSADEVQVLAEGDIFVEAPSGALNIDRIATLALPFPGPIMVRDVYLKAAGAIVAINSDVVADVSGRSITLAGSSIGTSERALLVDSDYGNNGDGGLTLDTSGDVNVRESGDLRVQAAAGVTLGNVRLEASGAILPAGDGTYDLSAVSLDLISTTSSFLNLDLAASSFIHLTASNGSIDQVNLYAPSITLEAKGDIKAKALKSDAELSLVSSLEGDIELSADNVSIVAAEVLAAIGNVTITGGNNFPGGDVSVGLVGAGGDVTISARNHILDADGDAAVDVYGNLVSLTSSDESIGTALKTVDIDSTAVRLSAGKSMYVYETEGDLNLLQAVSTGAGVEGTIHLVAAASILDANENAAADVSGSLRSELISLGGTIGTAAHPFGLSGGPFALTALGDIDAEVVQDGAVSIYIDRVESLTGNVSLKSDVSLRGYESSTLHIIGAEVSIDALGDITGGWGTGNLLIDTQRLTIDHGPLFASSGWRVWVEQVAGDMYVASVSSSDSAADVRLTADGSVFGDASGVTPYVTTVGTVSLTANHGSIGSAGDFFGVDSGSGLNLAAYGDVHVNEVAGNLYLGLASSQTGDVVLRALAGSIVDAQDATANVIAKRVELSARGDGIGKNNAIEIDSQRAMLTALTGLINVTQSSGDLNLELATASTSITLTADGSIVDADGDAAMDVVTGENVFLTSTNGAIGAGSALGVLSDVGVVTLTSLTGINVNSSGSLRLETARASQGDVRLSATTDICAGNACGTINPRNTVEGLNVTLTAGRYLGFQGPSYIGVMLHKTADNLTPTLSASAQSQANILLSEVDETVATAARIGGAYVASLTAPTVRLQMGAGYAQAYNFSAALPLDVEVGSVSGTDVDIRHANNWAVSWNQGGDVTIDHAAASGFISVFGSNNVTVGDIIAPSVSIDAGALLDATDVIAGISATSINLYARSGDIGSLAAPLTVTTPDSLSATATGDVYIDLTLADAAASLASLSAGDDAWLSVHAAQASVLNLNSFVAAGDIWLLGDANTTFAVNTNIRSGTGGASELGSFTVNAAGQATAQGVSYVDNGDSFSVSFTPSLATGASNGHIVITGNATTPLQGSGSLKVGNGSSGLDIVNNSSKHIVLDTIDLGSPGAAGSITLNGVQQTTLPQTINGVTLGYDGSSGSGNINVTSNGTGDVNIAGEVRNTSATISLQVANGSIGGTTNGLLTSRDLVLAAANGSIGSESAPLRVSVGPGTIDAAARDYVWIYGPSDLNLGYVSGSIVDLTAAGQINDPLGDTAVDVAALSASLTAGSSIGGFGFDVGVAADTLYLSAQEYIFVNNASGNLNVDSATSANAYIRLAAANDVRLGLATALNGDVGISAGNSIVDIDGDSDAKIRARSVSLYAANGSIGETSNPFEIDTVGGAIVAAALGDVRLVELSGDMLIDSIAVGGDVVLLAAGAIIDTDGGGGARITANRLTLSASAIGSASNPLEINTSSVTLDAANGIYVWETEGNLEVSRARASAGDVSLGSGGAILDFDDDAAADIEAVNVTLVSTGASIGLANNALEMSMTGTFNVTSEYGVYADNLSGDLLLGAVSAAAGDVVLTTQRSLLAALLGDGANVSGRSISLRSGSLGSIGDSLNPLRMDSDGAVTIASGKGAYVTETAGSLQLSSLTTVGFASVVQVLNGDLDAAAIQAASLNADVDGGNVHIGSFAGSKLTVSVGDEGGSFVADDIQLNGRDKRRIDVQADNIAIGNIGYTDKERTLTFDLRGNDDGLADAVVVAGAPAKKIVFERLSTATGNIDLRSPQLGRSNKIRVTQLSNSNGIRFLTESLQVDVAAGDPAPFRLDISRSRASVKPRTLTRTITVSPRM